MNARTIRRAAERKANKLARTNEASSISEAQLADNRANAQLSTGPAASEGKRISSLNAVKSGLTGQTVLLPSADAALYERLVQRFVADHKPQGDRESELVQSMADAWWRLNRIPGLEMAIFARGRMQFAEQFAEYEPPIATALIDAETLVVYGRQFRNLQTQEGRIRRQYQKDLTDLQALQAERIAAAQSEPVPVSPVAPSPVNENGFEFSNVAAAAEMFETELTQSSTDQAQAA